MYLHITNSDGINWAMMDFMKANIHKLPVEASFNLVPLPKPKEKQEKHYCSVTSCMIKNTQKLKHRDGEISYYCKKHILQPLQSGNFEKVISNGSV